MPNESSFSHAFDEFAKSRLPERVHQALIEQHLGGQDSKAYLLRLHGNQRPGETRKETDLRGERNQKEAGPPKKGEERLKEPTRLERQAAGQPLCDMIAERLKACNVDSKRNSKGHTTSWIGYKLHIDAADGGIPVSCILTSASLHDSQATIPLAEITYGRVTSLYDMMDVADDAPQIKVHSRPPQTSQNGCVVGSFFAKFAIFAII